MFPKILFLQANHNSLCLSFDFVDLWVKTDPYKYILLSTWWKQDEKVCKSNQTVCLNIFLRSQDGLVYIQTDISMKSRGCKDHNNLCTAENRGGKRVRLTQDVKRESDRRQTEAFEEAQRAEHGHIHREGHGQTEHQHRQHRHQQHGDPAQPETQNTVRETSQHLRHASVSLTYQSAIAPISR